MFQSGPQVVEGLQVAHELHHGWRIIRAMVCSNPCTTSVLHFLRVAVGKVRWAAFASAVVGRSRFCHHVLLCPCGASCSSVVLASSSSSFPSTSPVLQVAQAVLSFSMWFGQWPYARLRHDTLHRQLAGVSWASCFCGLVLFMLMWWDAEGLVGTVHGRVKTHQSSSCSLSSGSCLSLSPIPSLLSFPSYLLPLRVNCISGRLGQRGRPHSIISRSPTTCFVAVGGD